MRRDTFTLDICRGAAGKECPYALETVPGLEQQIVDLVHGAGWPEFLKAQLPVIRHHQKFHIVVSGCANGCSRPHVADVGFIRAAELNVVQDACQGCAECVDECPEHLVVVDDFGPLVDLSQCLRCGRCAAACPEDVLQLGRLGWRIVRGGRLGRRPRLAEELPGLFSDQQVLDELRYCLEAYMRGWAPGRRFNDALLAAANQS